MGSVRKVYGYPGGGISPIVRKPFRGDPAELPYVHNPEPITARGQRRFDRTDEYLDNVSKRKSMSSPPRRGNCGPKLRGLHPRPKKADMNTSDWFHHMWDYNGRAGKEYDHGTR